MKSLVVALLILATPLTALANPRGEGGHGRPPAAYGAPARPAGGAGRRPDYAPAPARGASVPYGPNRGGYPVNPSSPPGPRYGAPYANPGARSQQQRARDDVRAGRRVPLPQVIEQVRRSYGGEYVDTRTAIDGRGRALYVLRFRQRGRYVDVPVDAETGEVQR